MFQPIDRLIDYLPKKSPLHPFTSSTSSHNCWWFPLPSNALFFFLISCSFPLFPRWHTRQFFLGNRPIQFAFLLQLSSPIFFFSLSRSSTTSHLEALQIFVCFPYKAMVHSILLISFSSFSVKRVIFLLNVAILTLKFFVDLPSP